jgi:hypothetical protein
MLTTTNDRVSQQNLDDEIAKESRGTRVKRCAGHGLLAFAAARLLSIVQPSC